MTRWFRHDSNAHMNERMLKIQSKFDWAGYGIAWFLLEQLYNNDGTLDSDAMQMLCKRNAIGNDLLEFCVEIGFLKFKDGFYYSDRLNEEIENRDKKSEKAKESAMARWKKPEMRTHSERNATRQEKTREDNNSGLKKEMKKWLDRCEGVKDKDAWIRWLLNKHKIEAVTRAWKRAKSTACSGTTEFVELVKYYESHA